MIYQKYGGIALLLFFLGASQARAEGGLVLVESLSAPVAGVQELAYIPVGATVNLGSSTVLVLDHLENCVRETITGGTVHVGADSSGIEDGSVTRGRFDCDATALQQDASLSQNGAAVYRAIDNVLLLHSTAPIIVASQSGTVRIERIDRTEPTIAFDVTLPASGASVAIDMSPGNILSPGGSYRITLGDHVVQIRIDPDANSSVGPLLLRLVPI